MDKSRNVLREGYVYKHEYEQYDVLYFVLKENALCFHRRKVHKRHTPLGLMKLDEIRVESVECSKEEKTLNDSNNNSRFFWHITTRDSKLFLYCASEKERSAWLVAIQEAQQNLSRRCCETFNKEDVSTPISVSREHVETNKMKHEKQDDNSAQIPCTFVVDSPNSKSVYNSSHTNANEDNTVGNEDILAAISDKPRPRLRSHSLSELIYSTEFNDNEEYTRYWKSHTAPLDGGRNSKTFKTVDKLIDVHSTWCRQLVRWI